MGLNIKKASTEQAIRDLAARMGESLTDAVETAVLEKLRQLDADQPKPSQTVEEFLARIKPLQDEIAEYRRQHGDTRSAEQIRKDFDDEFYDEYGLPK